MTREQQLEHRLAMILDDLNAIKQFVQDNGLEILFEGKTPFCDSAHTHLMNIEIACDLQSDEALRWKAFTQG